MPFLTDLEVKILSGGKRILLRPLVYRDASEFSQVTVPAGFLTDFASIPDLALSIVNGDDLERPAVLHDYLYSNHIGTRSQADGLLLRAMREVDVGILKRWAVYLAVRVAGWVAWK